MDAYRHHASGFFAHREEAEGALSRLLEQGLPHERLQIFDASQAPPAPTPLAELALVATSVSLFVASPLVAPLVMLGWGGSVGGLVGASPGNDERKDGRLSDLVSDAIASGQVVLVAETRTEAETLLARNLIRDSVGDCKDLNVAENRTEF